MAKRFKNTEAEGKGADGQDKPPPTYTGQQKKEALTRVVDCHRELVKAQDKVKKANGRYRAELKECAKIRGVDVSTITSAIKLKDAEASDVLREMQDTNTALHEMRSDIPLFSFFGEKPGGEAGHANGKGKSNGKASKAEALDEARKMGAEAGKSGASKESCGLTGAERKAWLDGWNGSQADIIGKMGRKDGESAAATH